MLVEAASNGLPIVAPRIAGVEDIVIHGETGFLHEPGDERGMAASLVRLLNSPMTASRMGAEGRKIVRAQDDPEPLARAWIRLLVDVAVEKRR